MARVWVRALSGPVLVAVVIGAVVSVMCTGIITPRLWLGSAVCWSFVPVLQSITGLVFLNHGRTRRTIPVFLDRLFNTHRPWTLWYLAVAGALLVWPTASPLAVEVSALVPLGLTVPLLIRLCVDTLGVDRATAVRRVAAHQVATGVIILGYVQATSQLVPRVIGLLQR